MWTNFDTTSNEQLVHKMQVRSRGNVPRCTHTTLRVRRRSRVAGRLYLVHTYSSSTSNNTISFTKTKKNYFLINNKRENRRCCYESTACGGRFYQTTFFFRSFFCYGHEGNGKQQGVNKKRGLKWTASEVHSCCTERDQNACVCVLEKQQLIRDERYTR